MRIKVYLIRHKRTGEFMPQMRRRGYTHWNPDKPEKLHGALETPRLFPSERTAKAAVTAWNNMPNAGYRGYTNYAGENDYDIEYKDDGRKIEDLEVVPANLVI